MAIGSYIPLPVREVSIPKSYEKERLFGIPTMCVRVAQEVISAEVEQGIYLIGTESCQIEELCPEVKKIHDTISLMQQI